MNDTKQLFVTNPHGAQEVILLEASEVAVPGYKVVKPGNRLYTIRDTSTPGDDGITMTGDEIDSLCKWWLEYKRAK